MDKPKKAREQQLVNLELHSCQLSSGIEHYKTLKGDKGKVLACLCCFFKPIENGECSWDIKKYYKLVQNREMLRWPKPELHDMNGKPNFESKIS